MGWFGLSLQEGVYGFLIYISANIIFLFILFGAILEIVKARDFFTMVGIWVGSKVRGGAAQTSVISSGLVGSVVGDPAANIVIAGTVCLPLMTRAGFRNNVAAAIQAAASSGGMLLPPVMGAQAFIMMSLTGLSYWTICIAAFLPAILYYLGIGVSVYLYSASVNIPRVEEEVDRRVLLRRAPLFMVPFVLVMVLLAMQFSPMYAAGWAMLSAVFLGVIDKETRPSWSVLMQGLASGAKLASSIAPMLILANLAFVSVLNITGLGPKMGGAIYTLSGGYLPLVLIFAMLTSLLLGMVEPVIGAYLVVALIVAPILTDPSIGLSLLQAHLFCLYYSVIGFLTPPVAPSIIIAGGLIKTNFMRSAGHGMRMIASGYLLPFLFCYSPALIAQFEEGGMLQGLISVVVALLVIMSLSILLFRQFFTKLGLIETGLALVSTLGFLGYFFLGENIIYALVGIVCLVLLSILQLRKRQQELASATAV